jgi:hypothetical protein
VPRPQPTPVLHFTHVSHLESIVQNGLLADARAHAEGLLTVEVGNRAIKERRQRRTVPIEPGGTVADYVPFYFASRSPMMYAIERGGVTTYLGGCDELIYLVTTVERLRDVGDAVIFTDRNAVLEFAEFSADLADLDDLVDWPLMRATYWANTPEDPDRRERRMAECLVHGKVRWEAFTEIACRNRACADAAQRVLASLEQQVAITVRPGWYF